MMSPFRIVVVVMFAAMSMGGVLEAGQQDAGPCVAIVLPAVQGVEGNAVEVGGAIRDLFAGYLAGPSLRVVTLDARLASQATEEARQKGCGHLLIASASRKRSGGGGFGKLLGQAGSTMAWGMPGGGSIRSAVARGAAVAGTQALSQAASSTKAKDEMRLEYRLTTSDGGVVVAPGEVKAKASVDGEDLMTPLVQRASEAIVGALSAREPR